MSEAIDNIHRDDAVKLICSHMKYSPEKEIVALSDACGRTVFEDIRSRYDVPAVRCSRWDGIVFSYDAYREIMDRETNAGDFSSWKEGVDYSYSNTGIPVSREEFDTMVMIEQTRFEDGCLREILTNDVEREQNIIFPGEKMAQGELLASAGTYVTPAHLNIFAMGGVMTVPVKRKPRVAIIPTGDELVPGVLQPGPGQTVESNSYSMAAKLKEWGAVPLLWPIQPDNPELIQATLRSAAKEADLIVAGGGSGRGLRDYMQDNLSAAGRLYFSSVYHGPGKRTGFAVVDGTPVISLVGPPGGEEMTFDFYVKPAVFSCLGREFRITSVEAVLDEDLPPHHKTDFMYPLLLTRTPDGVLHASPVDMGRFDRDLTGHNGYIFVRKASDGLRKGSTITVEIRTGCENL